MKYTYNFLRIHFFTVSILNFLLIFQIKFIIYGFRKKESNLYDLCILYNFFVDFRQKTRFRQCRHLDFSKHVRPKEFRRSHAERHTCAFSFVFSFSTHLFLFSSARYPKYGGMRATRLKSWMNHSRTTANGCVCRFDRHERRHG